MSKTMISTTSFLFYVTNQILLALIYGEGKIRYLDSTLEIVAHVSYIQSNNNVHFYILKPQSKILFYLTENKIMIMFISNLWTALKYCLCVTFFFFLTHNTIVIISYVISFKIG